MRRRLRKQLTILAVLAAFFGGLGALIFIAVYEPPPPPPPPPPTFSPLVVKSTAVFESSTGHVDLLAIVQNPNGNVGVRSVDYVFEVRAAGVLVTTTVPGKTFFLPGQEKPIVVLGVEAPSGANAVTIRLGEPEWVLVDPTFQGPSFLTVSRTSRIRDGLLPVYEVKGVLANESDLDYLVVEVTGFGVDAQGELVGVGKTFVGSLLSRERREYTISWPLPEAFVVSEVRVFPEVNVFSSLAVQPRTGESHPEIPRGASPPL